MLAAFMAIALTACGGGGGVCGWSFYPPVAPNITIQPADQSVITNQTATFYVVATGSATLSYQWKKDGNNIAGATNSIFSTSATSKNDNGALYSVVVSNCAGSVTSSKAMLTLTDTSMPPINTSVPPIDVPVNPNATASSSPVITTQPADQSVVAGHSAAFSVTASGAGPLAYQWKKYGTDIRGATASTYTMASTHFGDDGAEFSVVVSNSAGTVTSNHAKLTIAATGVSPSITTQPANQSVVAGQPATFSVVATGYALSYQWKRNGYNISGATSSTYTTPASSIWDNGALYSVDVSNVVGTVTSNTATLTFVQSQATGYSLVTKADGDTYDKTECVKNDSTGLVWEGKTVSGTRAGTNTYTNFDATYTGGTAINASTNSMGYVNAVNALALCGFTDWRMPTRSELQEILKLQAFGPQIDTTWFPNTQIAGYWTSTPYLATYGHVGNAWSIFFRNGNSTYTDRSSTGAVRLVRTIKE
ncbi:MAG: DUF1566 domain-containing protein [Rhodoferax sp.]|nr:DUF1566 domain-containing protein [Rhodoferax sp.]